MEERYSKMEGREDASFVTGLVTMLGSVLIEGIHLMMMTTTTTTTTILGATIIKGMENSTTKEKGILPLLNIEMFDLSKYQETPGMMNLMLYITRKNILISSLSTASPLDTLGNWLIDSGASRHFTGYREALSNLIEKETNLEIILGDNATYLVKGVGNVTLKLNQGNTIHLQEVLYVPNLEKNLISISAMEDKGFKVAFTDEKVRVWKRNFKESFTLGLR